MDYTSFSHGQVISKVWLCENLEPFLPRDPEVAILGSWYNVLALLLLARQPSSYSYIMGIDSDPEAIGIADKICDAYRKDFGGPVENICGDANFTDLSKFDVVISCSVEHMDLDSWFDSVADGALVCVQSSDMKPTAQHWNILTHCESVEQLEKRFPMREVLFAGEKRIGYETWGYTRFMLIGRK